MSKFKKLKEEGAKKGFKVLSDFSEHEKIAIEKGYKKRGKYYELEKGSYTHQIYFIREFNFIQMTAWVTGQFDTNTYNSGVFDAEKVGLEMFKDLLEFFLTN